MELVKKRNEALLLTSKRQEEINIECKRLTDFLHSEVKKFFAVAEDFTCRSESVSHWIANHFYIGQQTTANYGDHAELALFTPEPFTGFGQIATTRGVWLFNLVNSDGEDIELKLKVEIDSKDKSLEKIIKRLERNVPFQLLDYKFKFYKYDKNNSSISQEKHFEIVNDLPQILTSIILNPC